MGTSAVDIAIPTVVGDYGAAADISALDGGRGLSFLYNGTAGDTVKIEVSGEASGSNWTELIGIKGAGSLTQYPMLRAKRARAKRIAGTAAANLEVVGCTFDSTAGTGSTKYAKAVDANAAATLAARAFYRADRARTVSAVHFIPNAALTAHDTTYGTLTVELLSAAGAVVGTVASQTTKITGGSGDFTDNYPVPLTLGAQIAMTAGQQLAFSVTKASTGVAVPAGVVQVDFSA